MYFCCMAPAFIYLLYGPLPSVTLAVWPLTSCAYCMAPPITLAIWSIPLCTLAV